MTFEVVLAPLPSLQCAGPLSVTLAGTYRFEHNAEGDKRQSEVVRQKETPMAPRGSKCTPPNHTRVTTLHGLEGLPQDGRGQLRYPAQ